MNNELLPENQLENALRDLDVAWSLIPGQGLVRVFGTGSFAKGVELIVRLGRIVEKYNHHPEVNLASDEVEIVLTTHEAGGVTQKDLQLAQAIDDLIHAEPALLS